jgi:hypothetical protein
MAMEVSNGSAIQKKSLPVELKIQKQDFQQ